jgi:PAS domain S-box-containing protein
MSNVSNQWTYVNQTWLDFTGHSFEAALAAGWANGIHPDDLGRCVNAYTAAFERQERFQMEYRLRRYDGEYRSIVATGVPACDAHGLFTGYIGCAIDLTERRLAEEALSKLSHRLLNAQDEERACVARELHDDIGQRLVLLNISIDILLKGADCDPETSRRIEEAREHVVGLVDDVRAYSHRLHPWRLQYLGIAKAAAALCRDMAAQHDVEVSFHADSSSEGLSKRISMCLYRVLQEALQNAIKHSGTLKIDVSLGSDGDEIELSVQDFGIGFNAGSTGGFGLGLTSIKERVTALGGQLAVLPAPQLGTTIRVRVPLQDVDVASRHDGAPLK